MKKILIILAAVLILTGCVSHQKIVEEHCRPADNINWSAGDGECLRIITANSIQKPRALIILLHGDGSGGGPTDYLAKLSGRLSPEEHNFVTVAIMRPGYYDSEHKQSSGNNSGRRDSYTAHNIKAVAMAIKNLKEFYQPEKVILAGVSGGAAITGVIIRKYPDLADGAVLAACPCNIERWRRERRRRPWKNSLSPVSFAETIAQDTKIVALVGANDDNTSPQMTKDYINHLKSLGKDASYQIIDGFSHSGIAITKEFYAAIIDMAK